MIDDWVFVDTNILVYAYDTTAGEKHSIAVDLIAGLWKTGKGIISTQVLQELFVTLSGKIPNPVDHETVTGIIRDLLNWRLIVNDGFTILEAINIQKKYLLSFWDSLIIGAVVGSEARMLVTEDLSHNQMIENIKIVNPFFTPVPI